MTKNKLRILEQSSREAENSRQEFDRLERKVEEYESSLKELKCLKSNACDNWMKESKRDSWLRKCHNRFMEIFTGEYKYNLPDKSVFIKIVSSDIDNNDYLSRVIVTLPSEVVEKLQEGYSSFGEEVKSNDNVRRNCDRYLGEAVELLIKAYTRRLTEEEYNSVLDDSHKELNQCLKQRTLEGVLEKKEEETLLDKALKNAPFILGSASGGSESSSIDTLAGIYFLGMGLVAGIKAFSSREGAISAYRSFRRNGETRLNSAGLAFCMGVLEGVNYLSNPLLSGMGGNVIGNIARGSINLFLPKS